MAEGRKVTSADLELNISYSKYEGVRLKEAKETLEKELIQNSLTKNKRNISKVADELGISRPSLYELMQKLGIEK